MKLVISLFVAAHMAFAGVYGVKILSDNQPDYSDAMSFMGSIIKGQGLTANQDIAISIWKWVLNSRLQSSISRNEHGYGDELDGINYFNSFTNNNCGVVDPYIGNLWERTGNIVGETILSAHTTIDLTYDGALHNFDASLNDICFNLAGKVAGAAEIGANRSLLTDRCPQATAIKGYIYCADGVRVLGQVAAEYPSPMRYNKQLSGTTVMNQYYLSVRPYESYKRYKNPLDTSNSYYIALRDGSNPNKNSGNNNCSITNGEWILQPDFTKSDWKESAFEVTHIQSGGTPAACPDSAGVAASMIFMVNSYNVITSMDITADVVKGASDSAEVLYSWDCGNHWTSAGQMTAGSYALHLRDEVSMRRTMLVKIKLVAAGTATSVGLNTLKIRTVTQVNRRAFFALDRGVNNMQINLNANQLERIEYRPSVDSTVYTNYLYAQNNMGGVGAGMYKIGPKNLGWGWVEYKLDAPGDIKRVTMGGKFWRIGPRDTIRFAYSIDGGATYKKYGKVRLGAGQQYNATPGWGYLGDGIGTDTITTSGARSVLMRCEILNAQSFAGMVNAIGDLWMAADYQPPASPFKPFEITLCWTEFRTTGKVSRSHMQRITTPAEWTEYTVNVDGYRAPKMNYYTVNLQGFNPDGAVNPGYSDADVGTAGEYTRVYYDKKTMVSQGSYVTSTIAPSAGTLDSLTDERVTYAQKTQPGYAGFGNSYAEWPVSANPAIALHLGTAKTVQGVTIFQAACGVNYEYADSIQVYAGNDSTALAYKGTIQKNEIWNWPGDFVPPPQWDRINADTNYFQWNLMSYDVPFSFGATPESDSLIRLNFFNSKKKLCLLEVRAWSTLAKKTWTQDVFNHTLDGQYTGVLQPFIGDAVRSASLRSGGVQVYQDIRSPNVVIRALAGDKIQSLRVYDVNGRMVYATVPGAQEGQGSVLWNKRDNYGRPIANGNYFVKVNLLNGKAFPRVQIMK